MADKTLVLLTDDELAALDGKCRDEIQAEVARAKERIAVADGVTGADREIALFVGALVEEAKRKGMLVFQHMGMESCQICHRQPEYAKHRGSSRRGHYRKGDIDKSRPLPFGGYEFAKTFISIRRRATLGCCDACWEKARPFAAKALGEVRAQIPEGITGQPPRFKRYDNRQCSQCDWTGHEGEMGKERTLMGDGWYPAKCPKCGATNGLFSNPVKIADGFTVIEPTPTKRSDAEARGA